MMQKLTERSAEKLFTTSDVTMTMTELFTAIQNEFPLSEDDAVVAVVNALFRTGRVKYAP
jgi:hypothetical protein